MMADKFVPPKYMSNDFHCPHCGVYAHQHWQYVFRGDLAPVPTGFPLNSRRIQDLGVSTCQHCQKYALWLNGVMIYPSTSGAPLPASDMPADVKRDYLEARNIVGDSPRGAAALLRLALQKLMPHLGEKGENLNDDIASLVGKGLHGKIQMALDAVRVIGNNAVHPGEIDLRDDNATASRLFELMNLIVEEMVTRPRRVAEAYGKIPESAKKAIEERDKKA